MSDAQYKPQRVLHRARGLLNSRGQPIPSIEVLYERDGDEDDEQSPTLPALKRATSLGASISRTVTSIGRSISFKSSSAAPSRRKGRHARAQSDTAATRPLVSRGNLSAPALHLRRSESNTRPDPSPPNGVSTVSLIDDSYTDPSRKPPMDLKVPQLLRQGTPMTKVSAKKHRKGVVFRLDPDQGQILYETKKPHIIPIECIKEIRTGADARYYREQFQLSHACEDRWLTLTHICDGAYKTLHVVAATRDVFLMWERTLRRLHEIRQELMSGLGNGEVREALWARQYWAGADGPEERDERLDFDEVLRMCRRLNINSPPDDVMRMFRQADEQGKGVLDFVDFQRFVKLLKGRPELRRLYQRLRADSATGALDFGAFERFMRDSQKSDAPVEELERVFRKYASDLQTVALSPMQSPDPAKSPGPLGAPILDSAAPAPAPARADTVDSTWVVIGGGLDAAAAPSAPPALPPAAPAVAPAPAPVDTAPAPAPPPRTPSPPPAPLPLAALALSADGLSAFLLSPDNSPFADAARGVFHDMARPLSEYYISSSHNTYLVGHQLVGDSTIEGYIRALLHSCRSVELDIYDGEIEPVVYHGKTLTSRVPVRAVCQAIAKYAFVASPYPIIISAEVHCGLAQQELLAKILAEEFGDALVSAPLDGRPKIEVLPSPEDLRGRIMLKAKNLYVSEREGLQQKDVTVDTESDSSTTDTSSASETEPIKELKEEFAKARHILTDRKELKSKAKNMINRVRNRSQSPHIGSPPQSSRTPMTSRSLPERQEKPKMKMSFALVALLVYTVGVKCRGINKKETYAPEHVFSLSESTANKILRQGMMDLIKHNRTHLVRIYPKGTRVSSTNYEPHRYWSAGAQLVALNWQTFDLGYMINHAMFQRNGRAGYVLKPQALREPTKDLLNNRTKHFLDVTVISAQQLPRRKDKLGREVVDKSVMDPLVEVSVHVPDWTHSPFLPSGATAEGVDYSAPTGTEGPTATTARTVSFRTGPVKNNGFNPVWEESFSLPFDCVGDMRELIFVRFAIKEDDDGDDDEPIALYCASLGCFQQGFRHLPLHDAQLSQYLFSTLFVHISIRDA